MTGDGAILQTISYLPDTACPFADLPEWYSHLFVSANWFILTHFYKSVDTSLFFISHIVRIFCGTSGATEKETL